MAIVTLYVRVSLLKATWKKLWVKTGQILGYKKPAAQPRGFVFKNFLDLLVGNGPHICTGRLLIECEIKVACSCMRWSKISDMMPS